MDKSSPGCLELTGQVDLNYSPSFRSGDLLVEKRDLTLKLGLSVSLPFHARAERLYYARPVMHARLLSLPLCACAQYRKDTSARPSSVFFVAA